MAGIREDIILDPSKGIAGLSEMDRATVKYARRQEKLYQENQRAIREVGKEIERLKRVRDASNSEAATAKYTAAIKKLESEQSKLTKETERYARAVDDAGSRSESAFKRIGQSANRWLLGVGLGALYAMQRGLRFIGTESMDAESAFTQSLAIMGNVTEDQKKRMIAAAEETSERMNFSLSKINESYYFLTSAGLEVEQQIESLPVVAEFAKAGMFDLATATDLLTDAQSALGLTIRDDAVANMQNMARIGNVLVKANQMSNASVQQFSEALTNRAAAALKLVNKDLEEGIGVLAAWADQGLKDRRAGEGLNIMLRDLQRAWNDNRKELNKYNVEIFDTEGNMHNLADIIEDIEIALGDMSVEQKRAALETMGFNDESLIFIQTLIGMSGEMRKYEKGARDAGDSMAEVAGKQMVSMEERIKAIQLALVDAFGPSTMKMMDVFIRGLEDIASGIDAAQEKINDDTFIKSLFPEDPRLEFHDLFGGVPMEQKKFLEYMEQQREKAQSARSEIRLLGEDIDFYTQQANQADLAADKVAAYNRQVETTFTYLGEQRDDIQRYVQALKNQLELEDLSLEEKAKIRIELRELRPVVDEINAAYDKYNRILNDSSDAEGAVNDELDNRIQLTRRSVEAVTDIGLVLREISATDALFSHATGIIQRYNNQLTAVHNELSAGIITQEEYEDKVESLSSTYLSALQHIYKLIKDKLTPAQQEVFKKLFGSLEDVNESADEAETKFGDIADAASSVLTLAEAFGDVDDNIRNTIRGSIELLRNLENMKNLGADATLLDKVIPGLGIASGVISIIQGIAGQIWSGGNSEARLEELELINEMRSLRRQIARNTEAILKEAQIGSNISQNQIEKAEGLLVQLMNASTGGLQDKINTTKDLSPIFTAVIDQDVRNFVEENLRDVLNQLSESGIPGLDNIGDFFDNLLTSVGGESLSFQELEEVINILISGGDGFDGLNHILSTVNDNLGQFGESIAGAIERFNIMTKLGQDRDEAFDTFIQDVIDLIGDDNAITKALEEIAASEDSEQRKTLAKELFDLFQDNPSLIGSELTGSDLQEIIDMILREGDSASGSTSDTGFSRSVQIARSITEIQANEVVALLEAIEYWTRQTAARVGDETALSLDGIPRGEFMGLQIDLPMPVEITNWSDMAIMPQSQPAGHTVSVGSITVHAPAGSDPGGIDYDALTNELADRLRREIDRREF